MSAAVQRHSVLDTLRGIAALAVCWYHFTNGNPAFLSSGVVKTSGSYGWLGVEIFFVISGFIIPFALSRSHYHYRDYGTFLLKRIVRLDPPYLSVLALIIVLGYASSATPGFQGPRFHVSWLQLLLHLAYTNVFFGYPWLSPVFWTLAIELQYYLIVGLMFPLISHQNRRTRFAAMLLLFVPVFLVRRQEFVCHWLILFLMGICTFQYRTRLLNLLSYCLCLAFLTVVAVFYYGAVITFTGLATACIIAFVESEQPQPLVFFGRISYSLYLLHVPIGGRIINLSLRFVHGQSGKLGILMAALSTTTAAAWVLHRYVERPAQRWSSSINYKRVGVPPPAYAPNNA
ncbi:MAG TPA: acyltransferase [Chthoniobacterales bacterium]